MEGSSEGIVEQYHTGQIDRRSALKRLISIGMSAPAAYGLLGELSTEDQAHAQSDVPGFPGVYDIERQIKYLISIATDNDTKRMIESVREAKDDQSKLAQANRYLGEFKNPLYLEGMHGIPPGMARITLRIFEKASGFERTLVTQDVYDRQPLGRRPPLPPETIQGPSVCASIGLVVCVSVGSG